MNARISKWLSIAVDRREARLDRRGDRFDRRWDRRCWDRRH